MKLTIAIATAAAGLAVFVGGCDTKARQINETQAITTISGIDIQDWNKAANELSTQMLASGVLENAPRKPAVLAISRFVNNTTQQVDMDLLNKTVRINLLNSGKVLTTTTTGLGGQAEDPLAAGIAQERAILTPGTPPQAGMSPDYTLTGKIIQVQARAGNMRQSTFAFQMSLTDVRNGLAVWEGEKQIIKQGTKAGVGF
jgi:uncharacterized protein (TIGR02722 family)